MEQGGVYVATKLECRDGVCRGVGRAEWRRGIMAGGKGEGIEGVTKWRWASELEGA